MGIGSPQTVGSSMQTDPSPVKPFAGFGPEVSCGAGYPRRARRPRGGCVSARGWFAALLHQEPEQPDNHENRRSQGCDGEVDDDVAIFHAEPPPLGAATRGSIGAFPLKRQGNSRKPDASAMGHSWGDFLTIMRGSLGEPATVPSRTFSSPRFAGGKGSLSGGCAMGKVRREALVSDNYNNGCQRG